MKLLVQSDDYAITPAASSGIVYGIRHGIIRNTGMFSNMPNAHEDFELIKPYLDQIAFGIDLNASTGCSLLGYEKVPALCHEDGSFLTSKENRSLDTEENGFDHVDYEQTRMEFEAQIEEFVRITGKKPDYLHRHAYMTKTTDRVIHDLAVKYGVPDSNDYMGHELVAGPKGMGWLKFPTANEQFQSDLKSYIVNDEAGLLSSGKEYGFLGAHCGFVDMEIFRLSSFNALRATDLDAMVSPAVKQWVEQNGIELISYRDLDERFYPRGE